MSSSGVYKTVAANRVSIDIISISSSMFLVLGSTKVAFRDSQLKMR